MPHLVPASISLVLSEEGEILEEGKEYCARIEMPVHPKHDVGIFFKAQSKPLAKINKIHERDEKEAKQ